MAGTSADSNQQQYMNDLEKCGIATSNNLRELLTTCPDPVEGIRQFQMMNSVQLSSLKPVMKLLDLHGIRRSEYHEAVITDLTDRMVQRLRALGQRQTPENVQRLEQHLERCFRLYRVPRIRPIVLETLAQLPKVADRYLKLIICDKELYDQCAVTVRQQIWVKNESLFLESVEPVLDAYIRAKQQQLCTLGGTMGAPAGGPDTKEKPHQSVQQLQLSNFFTCENAKSRRQKRQVQELISMVGQREQLYCRLLDVIRDRFMATENPHYCSLRFDVLMAAHDISLDFLVRVDPCHDFAWCLDACSKHLRTRHLDAQQLTKLKTLLDISGKKGQNKPIPEMAMIAGCPHILHLITSFAVKMLRDNVASSGTPHLPREMPSLQLLLKILQMGLNARQLLAGECTLQQLMDRHEISTVFLAAFSLMLSQDVIRAELASGPEEIVERFQQDRIIRSRHPSVDRFLRDTPVCALLWLHHLVMGDLGCPLSSTKRRPFEPANAMRYAEPLAWMAKKMAVSDLWVQLLVHKLVQCQAVFANEQTANFFIRRIFMANLKKASSAKFHLLRLCAQHRLLLPAELLCKASDVLAKCAEEIGQKDEEGEEGEILEDQQLLEDGLAFRAEWTKQREALLEAKMARVGEMPDTTKRTTELAEEGELVEE